MGKNSNFSVATCSRASCSCMGNPKKALTLFNGCRGNLILPLFFLYWMVVFFSIVLQQMHCVHSNWQNNYNILKYNFKRHDKDVLHQRKTLNYSLFNYKEICAHCKKDHDKQHNLYMHTHQRKGSFLTVILLFKTTPTTIKLTYQPCKYIQLPVIKKSPYWLIYWFIQSFQIHVARSNGQQNNSVPKILFP